MKILRCTPEFNLGKDFNRGLTLNIFYLIKGLSKLGIKHTIVTPTTNVDHYKDIKVIKVKQRSRFSIFLQGRDVYNLIKDEEFDVIHTHNYGFFSLYFYKKKLKKPMVHSIHGNPLDFLYQKPRSFKHLKEMFYSYYLNKYICKKADVIIALCDEYREDIIKKMKISPDKVYYVPTQVDASLFKPNNIKKDIDLLYTGRFTSIKQVSFIVKVIYYLSKLRPNINAILIGGVKEDNDYHEVVSLVKSLALEKNILILPPVDHNNLVNYYNRSKICIFIAKPEGIGKTALEAMSCGLSLVTNVHIRKGEFNLSGNEGIVGLDLNPENIAIKINCLLKDETLMRSFGEYNRNKIIKYFTPEVTAKKIFEIYKSILKDG